MLTKTIRHNHSDVSEWNAWKYVSWSSMTGKSQTIIWKIPKNKLSLGYIVIDSTHWFLGKKKNLKTSNLKMIFTKMR